MTITVIKHHDEYLGNGYYLVSEHMDKTWYKGDTPTEAVSNYLKQRGITADHVTIFEEV